MNEEQNHIGFPKLMTENELICFLRIAEVSSSMHPQNVVANLKRFHGLPCIHISKRPLYPLVSIRRWIEEKLEKEQST